MNTSGNTINFAPLFAASLIAEAAISAVAIAFSNSDLVPSQVCLCVPREGQSGYGACDVRFTTRNLGQVEGSLDLGPSCSPAVQQELQKDELVHALTGKNLM